MNAQSKSTEDVIALPDPQTTSGMALHDVLLRRRSCREFSERPLTDQQLTQLCWAAQGISGEDGLRTTPSAGALFPMTLFVANSAGLFEYLPRRQALRSLLNKDVRKSLQAAALGQECVGEAPVCLILAMNVKKTAGKYGDRAARYCTLEAGHAAQNVLLEATALGLGGVPVGAFQDRDVSAVLKLPEDLLPVYLLPVGYPR